MRSAILSSIGGFFLLLAALCVLAPSKISASPLALPEFSNGLTQRAAAAVGSAPLDFSRALQKRKKGSKSGKKGISKGAIVGIIIAIIIIIIIVLVVLYLKKRKAGGH